MTNKRHDSKAEYFVKFIPDTVVPPYKDPKNSTVKIGTFHHYRSIENTLFRDPDEGQRGLDLIVRKPSARLDKMISENPTAPDYDKDNVDENGYFTFEYHILVHEHLMEFNTWMFCCSHIEKLSDIPKLQERFKCEKYYFISDIDAFNSRVQRSLVTNIQTNKTLPDGRPRIRWPEENKMFLDGYKDLITYIDNSSTVCETTENLEEFFNAKLRATSRELWFTKRPKFAIEKEFRTVFYACNKRRGGELYTINDDSIIIKVNLTEIVSKEPEPYR